MATDLAEPRIDSLVNEATPSRWAAPTVYDRSSLPGDFMVMIAGQSEADYLRLAPEKQFCEFLDGIVYMPPRIEPLHQEDVNFLLVLIWHYNAVKSIGYVATGPVALRLQENRWVEPDLFVLPEESRAQVRAESFGFPPVLLVVEVLSPTNRDYDLETKAAAYREALVDEVWYVDRPNRVVIAERRQGDGTDYGRESIGRGPVMPQSLPGFWFDAGWLWQVPRPNLLDCLTTILAGPPTGAV